MKPLLPPLEHRSTRVRLLAATYEDALTSGTLDGGGQDKPGSRLNLHDALWSYGSYDELERLLPTADGAFRRSYLAVEFKHQPIRDLDTLRRLSDRMPKDICVPALVSLNAGYLEGQACRYEMPDTEWCRRDRRMPAKWRPCCSPGRCFEVARRRMK